MKTLKCAKCNKDLNLGLVLLSKPEIYPDNFRYLHCNDCGKTYLINFDSVDIQEVDYSTENIGEDILSSLDKVFDKALDTLHSFEPEQESNNVKSTCQDCNGSCGCKH